MSDRVGMSCAKQVAMIAPMVLVGLLMYFAFAVGSPADTNQQTEPNSSNQSPSNSIIGYAPNRSNKPAPEIADRLANRYKKAWGNL